MNDFSWMETELLGMASSDGYCSFIVFEKGFFGTPIKKDNLDEDLPDLIKNQM